MTTSPTQLLTLLLLGLIAFAVLALGLYMLWRLLRKERVVRDVAEPVTRPRQGPSLHRRSREPERRRRTLQVGVSLLLISWVLLGKYLLVPFFPRDDKAQVDRQPQSTSTVEGSSGARLAVSSYGSGSGPTVVLTHGWGADRRDWAWVLSAFPPGLNVVTWDLPGLGASGKPHDYSMGTLAGDLDRIVDSVKGQPVILAGHSVGGILNIEYARRYPQKLGQNVQGIVQVNTTYTNPLATKKNSESALKVQKSLLEPAMHVVSAMSPAMRALGTLAYSSGLAHLQLASQSFAGGQTWDQLDEVAKYAYRSSPGVVADGVLGMVNWDGTEVLPTIKVPTLIIAGNQDVTTLPAASDRMERDIPGAVRITVDPAAHMGPVEQAERYAEAISVFAVNNR